MVKQLCLLLTGLFLVTALPAQNWKQYRRLAEEALADGNYAQAAENFEKAWQKKTKKEELIFSAGEAYYRVKNYRKAVEAYQHVKDQNDKYPLVGLKYARCLKQDGQYDKAKEEFQAFFDRYAGPSKAILEDIIQTEIQGCDLGKEAPARADRNLQITHLGSNINTEDREFAPFPVRDDELYFSSTMGGTARIYSSQGRGNNWSKAGTPGNFPLITGGQFCHGAMAPDGSRFYFTICEAGKLWDDLNTRCEIYALVKGGAGWSQPRRLPDYINMSGKTATHPNVVHTGGLEILYFSSNREGGRGGLDIWYASRDLGADDLDFTFPVNLGPSVNSYGDEITPFYDSQEGVLYFSSNGQISMGGFDVFRSRGEETNWNFPENMGMPVNSGADDYFYVRNPSRTGSFLSSNRVLGGDKITTTNDDIFYLATGAPAVVIRGDVLDQNSGQLINDVMVSVYRQDMNNREELIKSDRFTGGAYRFEVPPGLTYKVEVQADGYLTGSYTVATDRPGVLSFGQPLYLETIAPPTTTQPPAYPVPETGGKPTTQPPPVTGGRPRLIPGSGAPGANYTTRGKSDRDNTEFVTNAPRYEGKYYKIQLIALRSFDENSNAFDGVRGLGSLQTEQLVNRNLSRVLIAEFFSLEEARRALNTAQANGFPGAYIVEYMDGERYGKIR